MNANLASHREALRPAPSPDGGGVFFFRRTRAKRA